MVLPGNVLYHRQKDLLELISPSMISCISMLAEILAIWQRQLVWLQLTVALPVNLHTVAKINHISILLVATIPHFIFF